jgi:PBP1b-binding outer membrane lipoprotein LpoB
MKYSIIAIMVLVGGCAHVAPQHLVAPKPHVVAKPVPATTPNAIVKKRWYDKFKHHPKMFH